MSSIQKLLDNTYNKLKHLESPHLDSEVILSYIIDKPREYILTHSDEDIPADKTKQFDDLVARRAKNEPVAYLINNKEFYGRNFFVDSRVHIPRPATEDLINTIKDHVPEDFDGTIADIGTGSGCIAITLALEFPGARITATDISSDALEVAQRNADNLNVSDRVTLLKGDLISPVSVSTDIIVANLPYGWNENWTEDKEVLFQPKKCYNGGENGLEYIKKLINDLPNHLSKKGQCFLEYDPRQTNEIVDYLRKTNFKFKIMKDLAGYDRVIHLS